MARTAAANMDPRRAALAAVVVGGATAILALLQARLERSLRRGSGTGGEKGEARPADAHMLPHTCEAAGTADGSEAVAEGAAPAAEESPAAAETAQAAAASAATATAARPQPQVAPPEVLSGEVVRERTMGLRTLLAALQEPGRIVQESIGGPYQMSGADEAPVAYFTFRMSHFSCKLYLACGTQDDGSQHLKLQTIFEDNRRSIGEEQRYFIANEWNATKRYTRLKCGSGGAGRSSIFTLEYDVLIPAEMPHSWGLVLLTQSLQMWYTSMVACVLHIVEPRDVPFATHEMIMANTLAVVVREQDEALQRDACPICLERFHVGEQVRRLPCMHTFHVVDAAGEGEVEQGGHCNIDRHLIRDKQCPVCKTDRKSVV